jgi:membrane protease YdiL (CAAX protease family)
VVCCRLGQALPMLLLVVAGEELFWRAGVALPVAARWGPWWGCVASALAFTLAHLGRAAGAVAGGVRVRAVWAWMVVRRGA